MKAEYRPHISLAETSAVVHFVEKRFERDLSVFSPANLQLILSCYIHSKGMKFPDVLVSRLNDYPETLDELLYFIDAPDPEMFRNPGLWTLIVDQVLEQICRPGRKARVWLPSCSSGEELYSLVILAVENNYRDCLEITGSSVSKLRLGEAEKGIYTGNSMDLSRENYIRSGGKIELEHYVERIDKYIRRKEEIRQGVHFKMQDIMPGKQEKPVDLIIYKNRLINYTPEAAEMIVDILLDSLAPGGFLVLGNREKIRADRHLKRLGRISGEETIYQLT